MPRVLMLVVLVVAVTTTLAEARANRIHVTVKIVQTTLTGDPNHPKLGDQSISSVVLLDEHETPVGTGTGVCTIASLHHWTLSSSACSPQCLPRDSSFLEGSPRCLRVGSSRSLAFWGAQTPFAPLAVM
jgi:hypothetical protein